MILPWTGLAGSVILASVMVTRSDVIAVVGAGKGGAAILETLLAIPGIQIKYVFDTDPEAPGVRLAKLNGIQTITDGHYGQLTDDPEVDLIFEVTGKSEVFETLKTIKHPHSSLLVASGAKIIFHLLETQRGVAARLEELRNNLELRIVERTEDIERANRDLEKKIMDYEKLTQKLVRVNEDKTRYLLQATHQLKAPFAAIQSYTDIILDGYAGDSSAQTRTIVEKIKVRCELLSGAIKEMLELAHLKSCSRENVSMEPCAVTELVQQVCENHSVVAVQKSVELQIAEEAGPVEVVCNRTQLMELFSAVIENAIQYSKPHSKVEISYSRPQKNRLVVSIKDHGIGIDSEHQAKIFGEYFRTNEAVRVHENGTGLGLAIAKQVAKIHGFALDVDSQPGEGTTFHVRMPIAPL